MLIEFSVSNFRSFREKQTLSMVAAPRLRKRENVFKPELTGEAFPDLLKVAVIYGPNASGKSNLLKALDVIGRIANLAPTNSDAPLPVTPFCFDPELADKPSLFELHFIEAGVRYQFNVAVTADRVVSEKLSAFPKGQESLLYERSHTVDGESYVFGKNLIKELGFEVLEAWKKLTPPKLFFIAQAVANSSESLDSLRQPFQWIKGFTPYILLDGMGESAKSAQRIAASNDYIANSIASFLDEVDVPISKITVKTTNSPGLGMRLLSSGATETLISNASHQKTETILTHQTALGSADLTFENESEGTKNLIGFWMPWFIKNSSAASVLIVDELDSSLHPKIVAAIVEKHIHLKAASQLIFTTHDTHLMDAKLLRRDQFWIAERDINGATQLRSIHDFKGRESEDVEKRYYEGRYRGLPILKQG